MISGKRFNYAMYEFRKACEYVGYVSDLEEKDEMRILAIQDADDAEMRVRSLVKDYIIRD